MFSYTLINHPEHFSLDEGRIASIFEAIQKEVPIIQKGELNIAFVSDEEMQELNRTYRQKDSTTDVLSFHYFEDFSSLTPRDTAGECIFSESRILMQASEHGHSPRTEFEILLIHSILHILGYDHETDEEYEEMWEYEEKLRRNLFDKVY